MNNLQQNINNQNKQLNYNNLPKKDDMKAPKFIYGDEISPVLLSI